ncbi:MAG: virulence RhuM family protein [Magnetococcales bacterium]|nr:virulence RhuM family protein [Magnetococcales bacterium]
MLLTKKSTTLGTTDWRSSSPWVIEATDREVLRDAGMVTAEIAKAHAESEFERYRIIQDSVFESDFDRMYRQVKTKSPT